MFNEKFMEVLRHEGVVSITSWGTDTPHVTCTWNSYLVIDGNKVLIPAAGMHSTQQDVQHNPRVILTLGSREVEGFNQYQGTGFRLEGYARFMDSGVNYDRMKERFPFLSRVLEVDVQVAKQLL